MSALYQRGYNICRLRLNALLNRSGDAQCGLVCVQRALVMEWRPFGLLQTRSYPTPVAGFVFLFLMLSSILVSLLICWHAQLLVQSFGV